MRNQPDALDGGATILEVSDPCQGLMELSKKEAEPYLRNGVLPREVYTDGAFVEDPRREKVFFTDVKRFRGALKDVYVEGANELRYGDTGPKAQALVKVASQRQFTTAEDLEALTLFGTSKEVVESHVVRTLRRAAARGQTVANGGVYIYRSTEASRYGERRFISD